MIMSSSALQHVPYHLHRLALRIWSLPVCNRMGEGWVWKSPTYTIRWPFCSNVGGAMKTVAPTSLYLVSTLVRSWLYTSRWIEFGRLEYIQARNVVIFMIDFSERSLSSCHLALFCVHWMGRGTGWGTRSGSENRLIVTNVETEVFCCLYICHFILCLQRVLADCFFPKNRGMLGLVYLTEPYAFNCPLTVPTGSIHIYQDTATGGAGSIQATLPVWTRIWCDRSPHSHQ